MTVSDFKKILKQLANKPSKMKRFLKHNSPKERKYGLSTKKCNRCLRVGGHVGKYGLNLCRHCFRELAPKMGWKKLS
jgi:small subunit ribosomal protein S14